MRRKPRIRAAVVAMVAAFCLTPLMTAAPASAASNHYIARAYATNVCKDKYGSGVFGASFWKWGTDGIYCYGLSLPWAVSYIGGVNGGDFQHYCRVHYGADTLFTGGVPTVGWWCVKWY